MLTHDVDFWMNDTAILGDIPVTIDGIGFFNHGVEYRVWYISNSGINYTWVTGDKLKGGDSRTIGFNVGK